MYHLLSHFGAGSYNIAIRYVCCCASNQLVLDVLPQITTCGCLPTSNRFHQTATRSMSHITSVFANGKFDRRFAILNFIHRSIRCCFQKSNVSEVRANKTSSSSLLPKTTKMTCTNFRLLVMWASRDNFLSRNQWRYGGESGPRLRKLQEDLKCFITGLISVSCIPSVSREQDGRERYNLAHALLQGMLYTQHSTLCAELTRVPCILSVRKSFWWLLCNSKCQ